MLASGRECQTRFGLANSPHRFDIEFADLNRHRSHDEVERQHNPQFVSATNKYAFHAGERARHDADAVTCSQERMRFGATRADIALRASTSCSANAVG